MKSKPVFTREPLWTQALRLAGLIQQNVKDLYPGCHSARNEGNPDSPAAPEGGQSGDDRGGNAPADPMANLLSLVAQKRTAAGDIEKQDDPPPSAKEGEPENQHQPADDGQPVQDDLPPDQLDELPPGSGTEGEPGKVLLQTGDAEADAALQELNADGVGKLAHLAKMIQNEEISLGEIKRVPKLIAERNALQQEIEELRAKGTVTVQTGPSAFSKEIAGLKTVGEVEQRFQQAESIVEAIDDFLAVNPNGGTIGHGEQAREMSREELVGMKKQWKQELKDLPKRAQQIQQQAQAVKVRNEAKANFERDFPWAKDSESPQAKLVSARLEKQPWLNEFAEPRVAAHIYNYGESALQAEALSRGKDAAAAAKATHALLAQMPWLRKVMASPEYKALVTPKAAAAARPQGKVPAGKPSMTAGGAAPQKGGTADVNALLKTVHEKGDVASLTQLVSAMTPKKG